MIMALNIVFTQKKDSNFLMEVGMGRVKTCELLKSGGRRVFEVRGNAVL